MLEGKSLLTSTVFLNLLLMFADSPEFLVTPEDVSGDLGQEVVLQCVADSNPSPAYKWFRNDNKDMVSISDTLGGKN